MPIFANLLLREILESLISEIGWQNRKFIPYKLLPKRNIVRAANDIKKIDKTELKDFVIDEFLKYTQSDTSKYRLSCSIKTAPLLKVPNAVILVTFYDSPFDSFNGITIYGQARILKKSKNGGVVSLPVIYLTPDRSKDILMHEKIHICQYLQDSAFPLTTNQRDLFLSMNLKDAMQYLLNNADRDAAIDFIGNANCYRLWIEMEANYHTRKITNYLEWLKMVYLSSNPIVTLEQMRSIMELDSKEMSKVQEKFITFCNTIENEVKWVSNFVRTVNDRSLYDWILEAHDEVETDMMLGPINEWEGDRFEIDEYENLTDEEFMKEAKKGLKNSERLRQDAINSK